MLCSVDQSILADDLAVHTGDTCGTLYFCVYGRMPCQD